MKRLILYLFITCLSSYSVAQVELLELKEKRKMEIKRLGKEAQRTGNYYLALEYFKELVALDSTHLKNRIRFADLLRHTRNYVEAEEQYKIICETKVKAYPEAMFYLATIQKKNQKYEQAIQSFAKFKKLRKLVKERKFRKLYKTELEGAYLAIELNEAASHDSARIAVSNLGKRINSPHIDFSPIPVKDDSLIFGSLRQTEQVYYKIANKDSTTYPTRKFFSAGKQDSIWAFLGEMQGVNSEEWDVANGTFSLNKRTFYFTRCAENWQYKVMCKIYYTTLKKGAWTEPKLVRGTINQEGSTSSHPTIGRDPKTNEEVLYFMSNRNRSKGGLDIWYSVYERKKRLFKKPKNAGSSINTVGDEMTPFYDVYTNTLYYSSDGLPTIGGLDIFKSEGHTNKWKDPENIGLPYNSSVDDLDYVLKPSAKGGFLVSNRAGGASIYNATCCDDIYEFDFDKYIILTTKGEIVDSGTDSLLGNEGEGVVNVYLKDSISRLFLVDSQPIDSGKYELNLRPGLDYKVEISKEGYFNGSAEVSSKDMLESGNIKLDIPIVPIPKEPILMPLIVYDFNSAKLTQNAQTILDTTLVVLMKDNPTLKIEIRSHTDSKGSLEYNQTLSERRASSVVSYLVKKGFSSERLVATGYGESLPIAPNQLANGDDNPVGRQKNRRTEFKVIGKYNEPDTL